MGRIGQSLIMLGQPPYCSLFSVWWADDGLRVRRHGCIVCVCVHAGVSACVYVYIAVHCMRWDKGTAGKKDPTLSHPQPPASRPCLSKLDFILQKQSGMNNSFSSPCFCFFFLSFLFLTFLLHSFLAFLSFLPIFASSSSTKRERSSLSFYPHGKDLLDFVHGSVISAVVCFHHFSWGLILLDVWVHA